MKKPLLVIITIFILILAVLFINLKNAQSEELLLKKDNLVYESFLKKEIFGTEVATLINKAVDNNEKYSIPKDEKGFYVEDDKYGIKIYLYVSINDTTYPMETIYKHGTEQFVQNFNSIPFKADEVEYHKLTGKISKIVFKQVEE